MFDGILNWLASFWAQLTAVIKEAWRQTGVTLVNGWTIMLAVIGWVGWAWDKIGEILTYLISVVDQIVFPDVAVPSAGPLMHWMEVANTFLPLEETFAFTVGFLTLLIALGVYRLIKSWIPTLS